MEPADYSISHTTPSPAHFIHVLPTSSNHLKHCTNTPIAPRSQLKKKDISKQSYGAKSSWLHAGQASSTVIRRSLGGCSKKQLQEDMHATGEFPHHHLPTCSQILHKDDVKDKREAE